MCMEWIQQRVFIKAGYIIVHINSMATRYTEKNRLWVIMASVFLVRDGRGLEESPGLHLLGGFAIKHGLEIILWGHQVHTATLGICYFKEHFASQLQVHLVRERPWVQHCLWVGGTRAGSSQRPLSIGQMELPPGSVSASPWQWQYLQPSRSHPANFGTRSASVMKSLHSGSLSQSGSLSLWHMRTHARTHIHTPASSRAITLKSQSEAQVSENGSTTTVSVAENYQLEEKQTQTKVSQSRSIVILIPEVVSFYQNSTPH